jgi:hypothetical protein
MRFAFWEPTPTTGKVQFRTENPELVGPQDRATHGLLLGKKQ